MESTHLLDGSKKRVKIHPHTVTAKYAPHTPHTHTHFPQPGDEGYDDAPSFEDFGSFLEETSDKKQLTGTRKWTGKAGTLFGGKDKNKDTPPRPPMGGGEGGQLASFSEASVSASRLTWASVVLAGLAHGCVCVLTRLAASRFNLPPLTLLLVRSILQLLYGTVPMKRAETAFGSKGYRRKLLLYGLTHSFSLCCAYSSLSFVSLGDDEAVLTTWRLATTILSATLALLLLDERLGLVDLVTVATGVLGLGLALVPNPTGLEQSAQFWREAFGWSLSVLAGLWMSLALVMYRSLKERVSVGTALFTVSWTGCLSTAVSMLLLQQGPVWPASLQAWCVVLGVAVCSAGGFVGVTHGLTRLHPALVSGTQGLEVPVAMMLEIAVVPLVPSVCEVIGGVVVVVSVGWLVTVKLLPSRGSGRKQREEYEEILDSPIK
ncbi:solute carrier family 35 member G2a [Salvelinus namaycush]|uniref:Solute carrier family 35 member G2a n=1 Tax=Salvelinus namaycush TaxID=8040 RepID=A0A8U0Q0A3_SALNM|nr:solute carrier family 35 member G2a [Salvelinus namaycush]